MPREMKDSGIEWIGEIPNHWQIGRTKNCYTNHKDIVGNEADNFGRLALTLNGVIKRSKADATGLQPEAFEGYQILRQNELVFKLIDLENVSTSRVGYSPYTGIVSPAYIILNPRHEDESRFGEYYFLSMWQREVFNHMGDDGVRSSLNAKDLLNIPYPLVPSEEKRMIVALLDQKCAEIDAVIEQTKATIEEYKKLKQSVITQAVTKGIRGDRPMKDSGIEWIGKIPAEWDVIRLRYFISGYKAGPFGSSLITDRLNSSGNMLVYTPEHIAKQSVALDKNLYLPDERIEEMQQFIVETGDIIFPIVGSLGRSMLITDNMPTGIINQRLAKFKLDTEQLLLDYFLWLFSRSNFYSTYIELYCRGSIIVNLTKQIIGNMPIPLPATRAEQQEICTYLDEKCSKVDFLIAEKESLITDLESYKKSLIYEYVTGKKEVIS